MPAFIRTTFPFSSPATGRARPSTRSCLRSTALRWGSARRGRHAGIAVSADGATLLYCPLSSRHLYSVPTALLVDRSISEAEVEQAVADLGEKGAFDGLEADDKGRVYAGDYERNSIRQRQVDGEWKTIAHDPRILWPDTLSVASTGYLYFTANQLHRQAQFHEGEDLREKPYTLFRIRIDAGPVLLK
jgi:sugar lactone lactonase YvrE